MAVEQFSFPKADVARLCTTGRTGAPQHPNSLADSSLEIGERDEELPLPLHSPPPLRPRIYPGL
jgi:hypothetical protein